MSCADAAAARETSFWRLSDTCEMCSREALPPPPPTVYTVSGGGLEPPYYTFAPPLGLLQPGQTYAFRAAGIGAAHPFAIGPSRSQPLPEAFNALGTLAGLTGDEGQIEFTVPRDYTAERLGVSLAIVLTAKAK